MRHTNGRFTFIYLFLKIVLEVQQRKLRIKNDSTQHMTVYS